MSSLWLSPFAGHLAFTPIQFNILNRNVYVSFPMALASSFSAFYRPSVSVWHYYPRAFLTGDPRVPWSLSLFYMQSVFTSFFFPANYLFITLIIAFRLVLFCPIQIRVCFFLWVHHEYFSSKEIMAHHESGCSGAFVFGSILEIVCK